MIWQENASCVQRPDLPWTTDAHELPDSTVSTMRAVCAVCPVLTECDAATMELKVTGGFWAGHDRNVSRTAMATGLIPELESRLVHSTQLVLDITV